MIIVEVSMVVFNEVQFQFLSFLRFPEEKGWNEGFRLAFSRVYGKSFFRKLVTFLDDDA